MTYAAAGDTGGTFTDLVSLSFDGARLRTAKALTTYDQPMRGLMSAVDRSGLDLADAQSLKFGTTLVINALLQRRGARAALLCTRGFRDTLEIRRGNRVSPFDLHYIRDPALIARHLRFEIDERMDAMGGVVRALDREQIAAVAAELRAAQVEAVAVSFLNAYVNDAHEKMAIELLEQELPGVYVTSGSDLTREWYEYERTSTAAANAFVGPALNHFLAGMEAALGGSGFRGPAYLMASNGGVFAFDEACKRPVQLVESGPVGGCIGAAAYARSLGLTNVIAFDMGGTTAKCALIEDGGFQTRSPYYVGGREKGFPIRGAVIDIVEVGAGGGSIASLDAYGRLTVGPQSAGSTPGPACYGRGGAQATITDANVALGRISEASFLAGEMTLDACAARRAIIESIAVPMGYREDDLAQVAQGILDIGVMTMSGAIAEITTERGRDPRDFSLFVFGGGGPLHGVDLARRMGIPQVIVPPYPGVFSAVGMLFADARVDDSLTFLRPLDAASVAVMLERYEELEAAAISRLPQSDNEIERPIVERHAELRYKGQRHALKAYIGDASDADMLRKTFRDAYAARFGFADAHAPIEFVSLATSVSRTMGGLRPELLAAGLFERAGKPEEAVRSIYFAGEGQWIETPVVQREALLPEMRRSGPLVVEEYGSSTILAPNDALEVGRLGELRIAVGQ